MRCDERDFVQKKRRVYGIGIIAELQFSPAYNGIDLKHAMRIAKKQGLSVWERQDRGYWIASYGCPPYLMHNNPDPRWTLLVSFEEVQL